MSATSDEPEAVRPNGLRARLSRALLEDLPFLSLVLAFTVTALVMNRVVGIPVDFSPDVSWELIAVWTALYSMPALLGFLVYSVVKKLASGNTLFENLTLRNEFTRGQCLIPAFEGLVIKIAHGGQMKPSRRPAHGVSIARG